MEKPNDKQLVRVTLVKTGEVVLARYYKHMVVLNGRPGYELRGARFCEEAGVIRWEPADESELVETKTAR